MKKQHIILSIALGVVTVGILGASAHFLLRQKAPDYQFVTPETHSVAQTVRASGTVTAGQSVDLSFVRGGRIKVLSAAVGDTVKAGQVLAELDNAVEAAQLSQARAALAQRAAGSTPSQIAIYQASVDAAQADLNKTKTDTTASVATAQSALDTAQNNLKLASGNEQSQIVLQAYQNANTALQSSLSVMNNALIQADNIIGVDSSANIGFQSVLSAQNPSALTNAQTSYKMLKTELISLQASVSTSADQATTDGLITTTEDALAQTNSMLTSVLDALHATVGGGTAMPQATLAVMETGIQATQTGVQAQRAAVVTVQQGITNAKNSLTSYSIAYTKAQQDLVNAQQAATGAVAIKQSMYEQAKANLDNAKAPVRGVDLGPLQAAVGVAQAAYDQTRLVSPIDAVVTTKNADIGSIAAPNAPVYALINQGSLQTEILVSEADVSKIAVGNHATMTLDAYGSDVTFDSMIVKIDPTPSTQNGVTGYKLTLQFAQGDDRIKAGMTANASIIVSQKDNVLTLPSRSIVQKDGKDVVFLLKDGAVQPVEQEVQVGVKGDDGSWEILSGVNAQDHIVTFGN